jgi:uncharacterized membrane protein YeaQ/YmgE (transglycosylase-associated protein family)
LIGSALDPIMWIGPIVGVVYSRSWVLPILLGIVGAVLDVVILPLIFPSAQIISEVVVGRLFAGSIFGLIAYFVAKSLRRG